MYPDTYHKCGAPSGIVLQASDVHTDAHNSHIEKHTEVDTNSDFFYSHLFGWPTYKTLSARCYMSLQTFRSRQGRLIRPGWASVTRDPIASERDSTSKLHFLVSKGRSMKTSPLHSPQNGTRAGPFCFIAIEIVNHIIYIWARVDMMSTAGHCWNSWRLATSTTLRTGQIYGLSRYEAWTPYLLCMFMSLVCKIGKDHQARKRRCLNPFSSRLIIWRSLGRLWLSIQEFIYIVHLIVFLANEYMSHVCPATPLGRERSSNQTSFKKVFRGFRVHWAGPGPGNNRCMGDNFNCLTR